MYILDSKNVNKLTLKVNNHYGVPDEYVFEILVDGGVGHILGFLYLDMVRTRQGLKSQKPDFNIVNLNNPSHVDIQDNIVEVRLFLDWMNEGNWLNASNNVFNERYGLVQDPYNARIDIDDISDRVAGMRMKIESMDGWQRPAEIVEMSGSLMINFTDIVESVSIKNELGDASNINPIGTPSANDGSISFINDFSIISDLNDEILPLEPNVIFHVWYRYGMINKQYKQRIDERSRSPLTHGPSEWTFLNQNPWNRTDELWPYHPHRVKVGTLLSNEWSVDSSAGASVTLVDFANILQNRSAQDTFIKNHKYDSYGNWKPSGMKVTNVLAQLLDSVNFGNYIIYDTPQIKNMESMMYAWSRNEETIWEVISDIAKTYQMALFFDQNGKLHIMSRDYLYNPDIRGTDYFVQVGSETYSQKTSKFIAYDQVAGQKSNESMYQNHNRFISDLDFDPSQAIYFDLGDENYPFRNEYAGWYSNYAKNDNDEVRFSSSFSEDFEKGLLSAWSVPLLTFPNFQYFLPKWKPKYQKYVRQFNKFSEVFNLDF